MKKFLGLVLLILSFSSSHLIYGQDCNSRGCGGSWEVLNYGCAYTDTDRYDINHQTCAPAGNTRCYFEYGYNTRCGYFFFKKCYLDSCNH